MKQNYIIVFAILIAFILFAGIHEDKSLLNHYPVSSDRNPVFELNKNLIEISGLTSDSADNIYTHNDEEGIIYILSRTKGKIVEKYYAGSKKIKKDFEGIALVNDSLYLITSSGVLYKIAEAENEGNTAFIKIKTGLSSNYNVEGLCYDSLSNSLLIACKTYPKKRYRAVYKLELDRMQLSKTPFLLIDLKYLRKNFGIDNLSPSAIAVHPVTNNFFILSSHEKAIVEISREGQILDAVKLIGKFHHQPEGITFLSDYTLVISDEGRNKKAKLTFIPFNP